MLTSNPRPRLTIFGRARDRKIAREPFLIYGRNGQHFSGALAGGPSHNSEIEARFYVEFKGIPPMRATRIDGTLPDESPSPHLFCMETKFSLLFLLSIQSFFPHLLLFSIQPSLQGVLSPLLYTFQFPSFKVRVAIKLALNLSLSLSLLPDAADSLWVSATQGKLLSWVLFYLKVAALKNLLVSLFSRMCLSLSLPFAVHFCNFVSTRASGFSMVFQETFFFHHFSLSAIFLCTN